MKSILWSGAFILFASCICQGQSVLYFPQFVDGSEGDGVFWVTVIAITGEPVGPLTVVPYGAVALTQENGAPMKIGLWDEGVDPAANPFFIDGGETHFFISPSGVHPGTSLDDLSSIDRGLPLNIGFATVTADVPITGVSVLFQFGPNGLIGQAEVPAATPLKRQTIFLVRPFGNTGVVLANPGTSTASVAFELLDRRGNPIVQEAMRTLAPNNHTAFFLTDLFPNVPSTIFESQFAGRIRIISDREIVSAALLFQKGTFVTNPIIPLQ